MNIVKVISTSISNGIRSIKILRLGKSDVQTPFESMPFGIDSVPIKNLRAVYASTGESGKNVIIGYININQLSNLNPGESRLFSTDSDGNLSFDMKLRDDGTAEIGGNSNFMVRFNELESGFNQLKSDYNDLVAKYNAHIHTTTATVGATAVPGVLTPTTSSGTVSTASIAGAKIDNIKTQ